MSHLLLLCATILVCLFGLPHGALDPFVAYQHKLFKGRVGALLFLLSYIVLCVLILSLWLWAPRFTLGLFLAYSALHFGRDWEYLIGWGGVAYGLLVIGLPQVLHPEETRVIFTYLTSHLELGMLNIVGVGFTLIGLGMISLRATLLNKAAWGELVVLASLAKLCTPLWYFVIFFCVFHSPRHLYITLKDLQK